MTCKMCFFIKLAIANCCTPGSSVCSSILLHSVTRLYIRKARNHCQMLNLKERGCFDDYLTKKKANSIISHVGRMSTACLQDGEYIRIFSDDEKPTASMSQRSER